MRKWLITGVSSGFGYELTEQLLQKGDTLARLQERIADYETQTDLAKSTDIEDRR